MAKLRLHVGCTDEELLALPVPPVEPPERMKLLDLRKWLKKRGLSPSGLKGVLVSRMVQSLKEQRELRDRCGLEGGGSGRHRGIPLKKRKSSKPIARKKRLIEGVQSTLPGAVGVRRPGEPLKKRKKRGKGKESRHSKGEEEETHAEGPETAATARRRANSGAPLGANATTLGTNRVWLIPREISASASVCFSLPSLLCSPLFAASSGKGTIRKESASRQPLLVGTPGRHLDCFAFSKMASRGSTIGGALKWRTEAKEEPAEHERKASQKPEEGEKNAAKRHMYDLEMFLFVPKTSTFLFAYKRGPPEKSETRESKREPLENCDKHSVGLVTVDAQSHWLSSMKVVQGKYSLGEQRTRQVQGNKSKTTETEEKIKTEKEAENKGERGECLYYLETQLALWWPSPVLVPLLQCFMLDKMYSKVTVVQPVATTAATSHGSISETASNDKSSTEEKYTRKEDAGEPFAVASVTPPHLLDFSLDGTVLVPKSAGVHGWHHPFVYQMYNKSAVQKQTQSEREKNKGKKLECQRKDVHHQATEKPEKEKHTSATVAGGVFFPTAVHFG